MESATYHAANCLIACIDFDERTRVHSCEHGDWYEHLLDHVLEYESRSKRVY